MKFEVCSAQFMILHLFLQTNLSVLFPFPSQYFRWWLFLLRSFPIEIVRNSFSPNPSYISSRCENIPKWTLSRVNDKENFSQFQHQNSQWYGHSCPRSVARDGRYPKRRQQCRWFSRPSRWDVGSNYNYVPVRRSWTRILCSSVAGVTAQICCRLISQSRAASTAATRVTALL